MEQTINIEELIQDDHNFNKGTEAGQKLMEKSFKELGAGRSILVDRDGRIISGNKSQRAAMAAGIQKVRVIETTGDELIAVKRTDLSLDSKEGREMAYADNLTTQVNLATENKFTCRIENGCRIVEGRVLQCNHLLELDSGTYEIFNSKSIDDDFLKAQKTIATIHYEVQTAFAENGKNLSMWKEGDFVAFKITDVPEKIFKLMELGIWNDVNISFNIDKYTIMKVDERKYVNWHESIKDIPSIAFMHQE